MDSTLLWDAEWVKWCLVNGWLTNNKAMGCWVRRYADTSWLTAGTASQEGEKHDHNSWMNWADSASASAGSRVASSKNRLPYPCWTKGDCLEETGLCHPPDHSVQSPIVPVPYLMENLVQSGFVLSPSLTTRAWDLQHNYNKVHSCRQGC